MSHENDVACPNCGNWVDEEFEICHVCGFERKSMRLLCCGDREWQDLAVIRQTISSLMLQTTIEVIIEGEQRGADRMARQVAESFQISVLKFPAEWTKYRKGAGPIRNRQMLVEGRPTEVLAFHNDISRSVGTKNMIEQAIEANFPVTLVKVEDGETIIEKLNQNKTFF